MGALLNEILEAATDVDWTSSAIRRSPSSLPPVAVSIPLLPLIQRLRFKEGPADAEGDLDLTESSAQPDEFGDEFWAAFDSLDRQALFDSTLEFLRKSGRGFTLGELAAALPPTHDLETLAYWLSMGREAEVPFSDERESIDVGDRAGDWMRFSVPHVTLDACAVEHIEPESLG